MSKDKSPIVRGEMKPNAEEPNNKPGPSGIQKQKNLSEKGGKNIETYWKYLEHKGPLFPPPYVPLNERKLFIYDDNNIELSAPAEEVAGFYAQMLDEHYTKDDRFNNNFFSDWRTVMTDKEKDLITDYKKCNFTLMNTYLRDPKSYTKEQTVAIKTKNEEIKKEYGFCIVGYKEQIGKFTVESPGLYKGGGENKNMGKLRKRLEPEDIVINCSKNKEPKLPFGRRWKNVINKNTVKWLASWTENVQGRTRYMYLHESSKLESSTERQKYEQARDLHKIINNIRKNYENEWNDPDIIIRQRAVALYFIDRLVFRAGNETDDDQADTEGCCTLKAKNITLYKQKNGKENVVEFKFVGKCHNQYYNEVQVEKSVFDNLEKFKEDKNGKDDHLFDKLTPTTINDHLKTLKPGLTSKVFRTYNSSILMQEQLEMLTNPSDNVSKKIEAYNRANRAVAILCNHQRACPKGINSTSKTPIKDKIKETETKISKSQADLEQAEKEERWKVRDKHQNTLNRLTDQLNKLTLQETERDETRMIGFETSKIYYIDPRITVAWCLKHKVPIEKIYTKAQRIKFQWAIPDYSFENIFWDGWPAV